MEGKVYLIGAGPGSPDLITLRGLGVLRQAEVIIYDYLVDKRILTQAKPEAELICADALGGKRFSGGFLDKQEIINRLMVKKARQGKKVARLKNGDPFIFGRASREIEALIKNKIEYALIPGVTAASAAASFSGIPLTDRRFSSSLVFVTGHEDPRKKGSLLDWEKISGCGTIVLYMAVENLSRIVKELVRAGRGKKTPAAIIENAGGINQKVITATLGNLAQKAKAKKVCPPAIVIIGETVKLEKKFNWLRRTKKIIFTGISAERFFEKGMIFHLPLIKIEPLKDYRRFDSLLKNIGLYDWIIFSSRFGVEYFFQRLNKNGCDLRKLNKTRIAAIGKSTANRLLDFGVLADLVPKVESSQGLISEFKKINLRGKRLFLPRSNISDKGLESAFRKQGANVESAVAYKNNIADNLPKLDLNFFDEIVFTSPSGVRSFVKKYKSVPGKFKVRCIGKVTRKEAQKWHLLG